MISAIDYIISTITGYYEKAHNVANGIIFVLLLFECIFFGLKLAWGEEASLATIIKKICYIGAWIYLANNIDVLSEAFVRTLTTMSNRIGSDTLDIDYLKNPFEILEYAYQNILVHIINKIKNMATWNPLRININLVVIVFLLLLLFLGVGVSFGIITIMILCVQIEFYIIILCAILLLPFMLNSNTKFIAEKIIPSITGQGIKLLVISVVSRVVLVGYTQIFDDFYKNDDISAEDVLYIGTVVALGIFMILQSLNYANSLISGMPNTNPVQQMASMAAGGLAAYKIVNTARGASDRFSASSKNDMPDLNKHISNNSGESRNNIPSPMLKQIDNKK